MADEIRVNRPSTQMQGMAPQMEPEEGGSSKKPWIVLVIVVIVIAVLGVLFREQLFGGKAGNKTTTGNNSGSSAEYQAVFLTNGQVYFGKISSPESTYVSMSDIYYLQVVQPPLQGQQQPGQEAAPATAQPQISLVKLGNELHGPVDEMKINRDQILFYEDLKADSQVVSAIKNYKANPPK